MNLKKTFILPLIIALAIFSPSFAGETLDSKIFHKTIVKIGNNVIIPENTVIDSAITIGGSIGIAGEVINNAIAIGGSVVLGPKARVLGNVVSIGGNIKKSPEAKIAGITKEVNMLPANINSFNGSMLYASSLIQIFANLLAFLGILALGIAVGVLFPKRVGWTAAAIERDALKAFLWGILWIILFVPITFFLLISIVGIPLIIIQVGIYGIALILGCLAIAQIIGKQLLASMKRYNQPMVSEIVWGIVILTLIGLVPVIGLIVDSIIGAIAIGASWISKLGEY